MLSDAQDLLSSDYDDDYEDDDRAGYLERNPDYESASEDSDSDSDSDTDSDDSDDDSGLWKDALRLLRDHKPLVAMCFLGLLLLLRRPGVLIRALGSPEHLVRSLVLVLACLRSLRELGLTPLAPSSGLSPSALAREAYRHAYVPRPRQTFFFEPLHCRHAADAAAFCKTDQERPLNAADRRRRKKDVPGRLSCSTPRASGRTVVVYDADTSRDPEGTLAQLHDAAGCLAATLRHPPTKGRPLDVCLRLTSPGGAASSFALAAERLGMLRRQCERGDGGTLTVCVDAVAASGGYMLASRASPGRLLAAPMAAVGSIGAVSKGLNVHELLQERGVRDLTFRAPGHLKAPLDLTGKVTPEGTEAVQKMLDRCYEAFVNMVEEARPVLRGKMEAVATGETWFGKEAEMLGLVDRVVASDVYLEERMAAGDKVLVMKKFLGRRIFGTPILSANGPGTMTTGHVGPLAGLVEYVTRWGSKLIAEGWNMVEHLGSVELRASPMSNQPMTKTSM